MKEGGLPDWIEESSGARPAFSWAFTTDAALAGLALARETSEVVAADESGGLYLLDRRGRIVAMNRGYHKLTGLAWADTGEAGFVAYDDTQVCRLDRQLKMLWSRRMPEPVLAIACDAWGGHLAVALANGANAIFNWDRKRVASFSTTRPLSFVRFLASEPALIAAGDYGLLGAYALNGEVLWQEKLWSNVGDLSISGDGSRLFVAGLNQGVQVYDRGGAARGAYVVEGTVTHVATTYDAGNLAATTHEGSLYWLDSPGQMLWTAEPPEPVSALRCAPLGEGLICGFESGRVVRLDWARPAGPRDSAITL